MKLTNHKAALVSDIHIGQHSADPLWHEIAINFAHWLKDTLIDHNIRDIIIPGDVLHDRSEVSVSTLHFLPKFFKILENFNIIILVGNHDCFYSKRSDVHSLSVLDSWPNITVLDKLTTISSFGRNLTFSPWATNVEDIPKSDILFGHFEVTTFKMSGNKICDHGVDPKVLLEKSPLVITGHFHGTQERIYKDGTILYIGSPYEQNWGESNTPKGIYILDILDNSYTFIENIKSPKHKNIRLSELMTAGKITSELRKEFNGNFINFIIDEKIEQESLNALVAKLYALTPIEIIIDYVLIKNEYIPEDYSMEFHGIDIQSDIKDFISTLEIENKEAVNNYLLEVYNKI